MHQLQSLGMMIPLPGSNPGFIPLGIQVPDNISVIGHDDHASGRIPPAVYGFSCISEYVDHIIRTLKVSLGLEPAEDDLNNREIVVPQRLLLRESTIQSG